MSLAFYCAAAVALLATVKVISGRHAVHALLYLVVSFLAIAVVFFLLGAPFAAALEVIVYAGAIMVLFLFVVMLLDLDSLRESQPVWRDVRVWLGPALLSAALLLELTWMLTLGVSPDAGPGLVSPKAVGVRLMGPYLLAVELASMLLLAGLVGAWHLGRPIPAKETET